LTVAILTGLSFAAQAQQAEPTATEETKELATVTVTGIRGSVQKSLDSKR
jgi:iron complex outermembrane receptor protein